eukprot:Nk52_evm24s226 gene=Nk52_evmTU24s226
MDHTKSSNDQKEVIFSSREEAKIQTQLAALKKREEAETRKRMKNIVDKIINVAELPAILAEGRKDDWPSDFQHKALLEWFESCKDICEKISQEDISFVYEHQPVLMSVLKAHFKNAQLKQRKEEVFDSPKDVEEKLERLLKLIDTSKHIVVYTGAGLSTSADIPDYRGPNGLYNRPEASKQESLSKPELSNMPASAPTTASGQIPKDAFWDVTPTYGHFVLTQMAKEGTIRHVVSQNCDGLHGKAGLVSNVALGRMMSGIQGVPGNQKSFGVCALSELHGNMFVEVCERCYEEVPEQEEEKASWVYYRTFDTTKNTSFRRHITSRKCPSCNNRLSDTIVHFGEKSRSACHPITRWDSAIANAGMADLIVVFGSSLKVLKSYNELWPSPSRKGLKGCKLVIVNLQWTPKDRASDLKIHAKCDDVLQKIACHLGLHERACEERIRVLESLAKQKENIIAERHHRDEKEEVNKRSFVKLSSEDAHLQPAEVEGSGVGVSSAGWFGRGLGTKSKKKRRVRVQDT